MSERSEAGRACHREIGLSPLPTSAGGSFAGARGQPAFACLMAASLLASTGSRRRMVGPSSPTLPTIDHSGGRGWAVRTNRLFFAKVATEIWAGSC